ncbi:MAG: hypothetical protein HETSPECPRED_002945 [Heterodermia speciosa]|uniref:Alpha-methylacyl-CoA racemase n=1 Tax=Heterodermia speciosa TaxID=116794 RepID=A0A8H3F6K2_9LECA|nr:MAG: hypothetical protein HETSPECPRED_002945 [Heterodermia speciosa]
MASKEPPLEGIRVVELAGLAPGPFASLLLTDYGASVLRVDRVHSDAHTSRPPPPTSDLLARRKSSIALDLKSPAAITLLKDVLKHVDVLIEPFRPGVLEALGLHPHLLLAANPRLVIARLTGFRRDGKYNDMAGHDINYLAVSGVLSQLGRKEGPPYPPANILADFAGGGLMCAFGIIMALLRRASTGKGQVVESNMVDGSAYLASSMRLGLKTPIWDQPRGENLLDGGCPFYDVYACKEGGYMAVGALEPKFYEKLIRGLGLEGSSCTRQQLDRQSWPEMRENFRERFLRKTRQEWEQIFDGTDACCTPVKGQDELEQQGYEQRPAVGLSASPSLDVPRDQAWQSKRLAPGHGGEDLLQTWLGWKKDKNYIVQQGGLVKIDRPKL